MERITLYFRQGASDKVYQAGIEPSGEGYVVNFAYGRRGSTMNTGTKTASPVSHDEAKHIYDKLVAEKMAKGYTEGENGTPYQHTDKEQRSTGILPQLLNPIEEGAAKALFGDPGWCMQEKFNGKRVLLKKQGGDIMGINRKGLTSGLPARIVNEAERIDHDFTLDGECVGDILFVFDVLSLDTEDCREVSYKRRCSRLTSLLRGEGMNAIRFTPTYDSREAKSRVFRELETAGKEGVVFKRLDAPYTPGKPASGGTQLKHKFYATLSAVVDKVNKDKRSVALCLLVLNRFPEQTGDLRHNWIDVGNVTIPPNHDIPKIGAVVEVRYLYAYKGGSLYQPVYLGERTDIDLEDCHINQLKYKRDDEEDESQ